MMVRYWKILFLAVLFSFAWGTWWGFFSIEKNRTRFFRGEEIRLLARSGVFPAEFIRSLEKDHSINIAVTEKPTELELLREILSNFKDYDVMQFSSFMAKSFIISNVFEKLDTDDMSNYSDISIDFTHLAYDDADDYVLPVSWGLSGFLINTQKISLQNETLQELIAPGTSLAVLHSPVEIFNLVVKLKPIIRTWVDTGQNIELARDLKEIKKSLGKSLNDPRAEILAGTLNVAQINSGQAARMVGGKSNYRFVLPKERGVLWLSLVGVSRSAKDKEKSRDFINLLLNKKVNQRLITMNEQATVLKTLNDSDLPLLQKAKFVREVPLSRVELYIDHEALDPIWSQAFNKEWPQ